MISIDLNRRCCGGRRNDSAVILDVGRATTRLATCFRCSCIPTERRWEAARLSRNTLDFNLEQPSFILFKCCLFMCLCLCFVKFSFVLSLTFVEGEHQFYFALFRFLAYLIQTLWTLSVRGLITNKQGHVVLLYSNWNSYMCNRTPVESVKRGKASARRIYVRTFRLGEGVHPRAMYLVTAAFLADITL